MTAAILAKPAPSQAHCQALPLDASAIFVRLGQLGNEIQLRLNEIMEEVSITCSGGISVAHYRLRLSAAAAASVIKAPGAPSASSPRIA